MTIYVVIFVVAALLAIGFALHKCPPAKWFYENVQEIDEDSQNPVLNETTTDIPPRPIIVKGSLVRNRHPVTNQLYVIDPTNKMKVAVGSFDRVYQDTLGDNWELK